MKNIGFFRRMKEMEYWPTYLFYIPNVPYALFLAVKARSCSFYTAVNPGIKSSGNGTESKFETLKLIPNQFKPKSIFVSDERDFNKVMTVLKKTEIDFPMIAKPDIGFRGLMVTKLKNENDLIKYLSTIQIPFIIQEFVDFPNECGVFYHRLPNSKNGSITSLTLKSFLKITGNGHTKFLNLIEQNERGRHYLDFLKRINHEKLDTIPAENEIIQISDIGNHCKGTKFMDGNEFIDEKLIQTFDQINRQINGWNYGRLDIKYNTLEELKEGKNFRILEINGIISEPTHIFDPEKSNYWGALKEIRKHWEIMYQIAKQNNQNGIHYKSISTFLKELWDLKKYVKNLNRQQQKFNN